MLFSFMSLSGFSFEHLAYFDLTPCDGFFNGRAGNGRAGHGFRHHIRQDVIIFDDLYILIWPGGPAAWASILGFLGKDGRLGVLTPDGMVLVVAQRWLIEAEGSGNPSIKV